MWDIRNCLKWEIEKFFLIFYFTIQSIGLILCRDKNRVVAEYSLKDVSKPIGVSEYKLTQEIPEAFKSALPDASAWEKHIRLPLDKEDSGDDE